MTRRSRHVNNAIKEMLPVEGTKRTSNGGNSRSPVLRINLLLPKGKKVIQFTVDRTD